MTVDERAQVLRQLSLLYNSGCQLSDSLTVVRKGQWSPRTAAALEHLELSLHAGKPLSESMRERPDDFDPVTRGLVKVGEETGGLSNILSRVADLQERELRLRRRLRSALVYPCFIAAVCFLTLVALMAYFVPRMAEFVSSFDVELSPVVRLIFSAASSPWLLLAVLESVVVGLVLAWFWARTETGRSITTRTLLRLPLVGPVLILADQLTIASALGQTQASGYPLTSALLAVADSLSQPEISAALRRTQASLLEGESLAGALEREWTLQGVLSQLLAAGEEAARIPQMCNSIVRLLEEEFKQRIETFTSLLEPALVIVMGVMVGATVLVLFLPMAKIMQQL